MSSSYSSVWIASDAIELNASYRLTRDGETVLEWTQSSSTEGSSGGGWGGFSGGGFGGPGGGGFPGGGGGRRP